MLFWRCLICVMLAGGVACGLARSDSWQLMVEAGLDGPDRRITPKSVFIAPVHASRLERCRPGFRYDHLGRCVKVVRVDANAQVHLFLKHLQGAQGLKTTAPLIPSAPSSNGPLQFSLPIAKGEPEPTESPSTTTTTTTTTPATTTTTSTEPTTTTSTVTTTMEDLSTIGQETTTLTSWDHTITTFDGSGSGDEPTTVYDGSGELPTEGALNWSSGEESGSGSEPTTLPITTEEERDTRSTTTSSEETGTTELQPTTTISPQLPLEDEMSPIPPNNATASLIYAILRGIEVWKASENITPASITDKLDNNTILIPLETIQLNPDVPFTTTERTDVEVSETSERVTFAEDSVIPVDSKENKVPDYPWSGGSWVRFPDESSPEESSLDITARDDDSFAISPKFRFPEEKVNAEQRPAILRFWSSIPMYKEEVQGPKSDEQWAAP